MRRKGEGEKERCEKERKGNEKKMEEWRRKWNEREIKGQERETRKKCLMEINLREASNKIQGESTKVPPPHKEKEKKGGKGQKEGKS